MNYSRFLLIVGGRERWSGGQISAAGYWNGRGCSREVCEDIVVGVGRLEEDLLQSRYERETKRSSSTPGERRIS